jgi:molybdenum cofactor guanylyltransferase
MPDTSVTRRAYLLAGGRSQRFGSDKARVMVSGQPNLVRMAQSLENEGWSVTAVAQHETDYTDLGLRCIADFVADGGPLAGILSALEDCAQHRQSHCLIATCDLIAWEPRLAELMRVRLASVHAAIACLSGSDFSPFPGVYATSVLEPARRLWAAGSRSVRELHRTMQEAILYVECGADSRPLAFNTHEELRQARVRLGLDPAPE